ncbi:MAG: cyclic-phosphate processing receiver domain-containing protein [Planctomycetota bacterium]
MIDLWLDDERDPEDPQIQEAFGSFPGMIWVKTAFAAINRLKDDNVQYISFDHDLGPGPTGYEVAKWIEERAFSGEFGRLSWSVHSKNPAGAKAITVAMEQAEKFWAT